MSKLLPLVVVLLLAACTTAARFPINRMDIHEGLSESVLEYQSLHAAEHGNTASAAENLFSSSMISEMEGLLADTEENKRGWPIHIVSKFLVKPDLDINFIRRWRSYEEASSEYKGVLHLSLNKVAGDNIVWTAYTVYRDFRAAFEHLRSEALHDFGRFITDANIAVEYEMLFKVGGCRHSNSACLEPNMPAAVGDSGDAADADAADAADEVSKRSGKHRSWRVRLITKYIVPPSELREFIEEWERLEKDLSKEKGNLALALFKPVADNTLFLSYSAWKSWSDFGEAARRKSTRQFLEFLSDKNIVAITKKAWPVPPETHRA